MTPRSRVQAAKVDSPPSRNYRATRPASPAERAADMHAPGAANECMSSSGRGCQVLVMPHRRGPA